LSNELQKNNYIVQSIRIVTNAFGEYLNTECLESAQADLTFLTKLLNTINTGELRLRFAIGEAKTPQEITLLPDLIKEFGDLCNACVNVGMDEFDVLDNALITQCATVVQKINTLTPRGEGNFNFTVNFNCTPLIPYFPASYHQSALGDKFVIGLETPDLLLNSLKMFNQTAQNKSHNVRFKSYFEVMSSALQYHASLIQTLVSNAKIDTSFEFAGFDTSAAPSKNCASMVALYQQMGVEYFGASGTVEASSLLTKVFKSIKGIDLVGFSGLMLALTEDKGLAAGSVQSDFDIRALLTYSAVCGIGLDTVPIPGNTSIKKISALMRDTGTMAFRLNKPLTVRVFPVPTLSAGELTQFESADLCNCAVLDVP
jgi:uncharacterized protein (UPF0210 family)